MILQKLLVALAHHHYPIYIGQSLFEEPTLLAQHLSTRQALLVMNDTLAKLYLPQLKKKMTQVELGTLILPDGEHAKTLKTWTLILDELATQHYHRDATLIAVGGGVVTDMVGFAAACYQRGISLLQIPTSLLAQVDASIGGKTAVNHAAGKNLIGTFYQPNAVFIDLDFLKTLPQRELKAGLAEIIKAALLSNMDFFIWLEENFQKILSLETNALTAAITQAVQIKRDIVMQDEKEHGVRALLNLGHTFAHAIEHCLQYRDWLHGEAVAAGLVLAAKLSVKRKLLPATQAARIEILLKKIGLPTAPPETIQPAALLQAMQMDKKIINQRLRFILLKSLGSACILDDIRTDELSALFAQGS